MSYNPYAAPGAAPPPAPGIGGSTGPQPWSVGEVMGLGWSLFKQHWGTFVGAGIMSQMFAGIPQQVPNILKTTGIITENDPAYWGILGGAALIGQLIASFFQVGMTKIYLTTARGGRPEIGDLFTGGGQFLTMLGANLLMSIIISFGMVMLIIPGIIFGLGLSLTHFFIVDQNLGAVDAMKASWEATKGQKGSIFGFGFLAFFVIILGALACLVGILAAIPTVGLGMTIIYLRISGRGQPQSTSPAAYAATQPYGASAGYGNPSPPYGGYGAPPPPPYGGKPGGGYGPPYGS